MEVTSETEWSWLYSSSPDISYCISMFAHSSPAHQSGSVGFLGVALSFPLTHSAALVLFQAVIHNPLQLEYRHLWVWTKTNRWPLCPGNGTHSPGSQSGLGSNPNGSWWSRQSRSLFGLSSQRESIWLNQIPIGLRFYLFFLVAGASESFRLITLIVLMWKKKIPRSFSSK